MKSVSTVVVFQVRHHDACPGPDVRREGQGLCVGADFKVSGFSRQNPVFPDKNVWFFRKTAFYNTTISINMP